MPPRRPRPHRPVPRPGPPPHGPRPHGPPGPHRWRWIRGVPARIAGCSGCLVLLILVGLLGGGLVFGSRMIGGGESSTAPVHRGARGGR
jgi:hypothetical protein